MKLATFSSGGAPEIGIVQGEAIISLSRAAPQLATGMIDLIARWDQVVDEVRRIAASGAASLPLGDVHLMAPLPKPGKILAIGLNYADHIAETGSKKPTVQLWFAKMPNTVCGPFDPVQLPKDSTKIDYEVEMVVVIGKGGRHISTDKAANAIFGYCVGNDVSARDWQRASPQWVLGKSFDTHGPFGPWITTGDEVDPHALGIRCLVNNEVRQNSNTGNLIFSVWDQIEHLSTVMTLEPGDIIYTGTPSGVGLPSGNFLKDGDIVRCELDGLGAIENRFEAEKI